MILAKYAEDTSGGRYQQYHVCKDLEKTLTELKLVLVCFPTQKRLFDRASATSDLLSGAGAGQARGQPDLGSAVCGSSCHPRSLGLC